jgi:O-antigen/teichoic acid export membrane protein
MNFARVARIEISSTIVASLSTLLLAANGSGVWALVVGGLLGGVARAALFVASGPIIWPSFRFVGIGRHVRFGGTVTLTRVLWQLTYQMDTLIAARFLTREALGLYSVAMHLATLPMNKAMGIVNQVAFPAVARLQDELPRLRARLLESLRLLAFLAIPSLWGISAVAPEFIDVVLGEKWHAATLALQLVSLAAPLRMLAAVLATALVAIGRADVELRNTIVGAAILPASFATGVHWHLNGLAVSWLIAVPLALAINFPRTSGALGLTLAQTVAAIRAPVVAGCVMHVGVSAVRMLLQEYEELTRLPILVLAGGAAYLSSVMLLDRAIWTDVRRVAAALRE